MKVSVYSLEGKMLKKIELPSVFSEAIRPDLIRRAFLALKSRRYQPKGTMPLAGLQTSAEYRGRRRSYGASMGRGISKLPRIHMPKGRLGEVRRVPHARGGRAPHPPKVEKKLVEKINVKERRKAIRSAIAATAVKSLIEKRGHKIEKIKEFPLVVSDDFAKLKKTSEVKAVMIKLNLEDELKRCSLKKIKAGRGKTRGRKYKRRKGPMIVISKDAGIRKGARNIIGVDVCLVKNLNADLLAPGGDPGRLTVYTESAIRELGKLFR